MRRSLALLLLAVFVHSVRAQHPAPASHAGIAAFNDDFASATRSMSNKAILALWDDDGTSLLPSTKPILGKNAIARFLDAVMTSLRGAHMTKFESECFDLRASGDWASEWCSEHQVVELGGGKAPFDGRGKMLLVLHRGTDGKWRIHDEMWNEALAPDSAAR